MEIELQNKIDQIDELSAKVNALRPLDKEQNDRLLQKIRLEWNYHSSKIEGNSLTFGETKALLLWGITAKGKPLRDHIEINGHNKAIDYIMDVLNGAEIDLNESFIRGLHKIILPNEYDLPAITPDGINILRNIKSETYKTTPNHVITATGEKFRFATPEETPAKMFDLITWYRTEKDKAELHPLFLATLFHYKFIRIHPFDDGNGRMARLLLNLILMQHSLPPVIIPNEMREVYLKSLEYADADDLTPFLEFIGNRLIEALELWLSVAEGKSIDDDSALNILTDSLRKK